MSRKYAKTLILGMLDVFGLLACISVALAQAPPHQSAPDRGAVAFSKHGCYTCHGTVGQGGAGPRLAPKPKPAAFFLAYVRKPIGGLGFTRNSMPAYSNLVISDAELTDIREFLASIPSPPPVSAIPALSNR